MARQASPKTIDDVRPDPPAPEASTASPRPWVVAVLLAIGAAFWVSQLHADLGGWKPFLLLMVAAIAATVPFSRRAILRLFERVRHPSPRAAARTAVAIGLLSSGYLLTTATWQGTFLELRLSDEFSYLIQARMLAAGYLWHAPHPPEVRPFFDTLNLLVEPTYGSMYFPGTALFYVPAVWLGVPFWAVAIALSGACVGLLYRLMVDLIDGVYALVAVLMLLGLSMFRAISVMLLSQTPMLMMGLLMMLAYIRWRRQFDWRWAALIGLLAGWSGITRPADALCYAVPICVAMLFDLARRRRTDATTNDARPQSRRTWLVTAASLVIPALPFLSLQVVQNIGMTGHWWEFPEARYADETYPAPMLGFHNYDPEKWQRPSSERKRLLSETIADAFYSTHRLSEAPRTWWELRLPETCLYGLPHLMLAAFLPAGLLLVRTGPRLVLAATLLAFVSFYFFYVFYIPHYMVVIAPALTMLAVLGGRAIEMAMASILPRLKSTLAVALPLAIAGFAVSSLPEVNPQQRDHTIFPGSEVVYVQLLLDDLSARLGPNKRAIVLFKLDLSTYIRAGEPVYTADVPWPDDARIIRAADLGAKNVELYRYYADTCGQPDRLVYVYDSKSGTLGELPIGTVGELAKRN